MCDEFIWRCLLCIENKATQSRHIVYRISSILMHTHVLHSSWSAKQTTNYAFHLVPFWIVQTIFFAVTTKIELDWFKVMCAISWLIQFNWLYLCWQWNLYQYLFIMFIIVTNGYWFKYISETFFFFNQTKSSYDFICHQFIQ